METPQLAADSPARRCSVPKFAKVLYRDSRHGRTSLEVMCACGHKNQIFLWSWAGHGKAKCKGCGEWIDYRTLQVFAHENELPWIAALREQSESQNTRIPNSGKD